MGLERAQGGPENPPSFPAQLAPTDFTAGALGARVRFSPCSSVSAPAWYSAWTPICSMAASCSVRSGLPAIRENPGARWLIRANMVSIRSTACTRSTTAGSMW